MSEQQKVKSFRISWDNHLRFKDTYSWMPLEVESTGKTITTEIVFEDGTIFRSEKHEPRK